MKIAWKNKIKTRNKRRRKKTLKELLEAKKSDKADKRDERMMISKRDQKEKELRQVVTKSQDVVNKFKQEYGVVKQALDRGTSFSLEQVKAFLGRILGNTGVQTDQDAARSIPSTMAARWAQLQLVAGNDLKAKAPKDLVDEVRVTIDEMKNNLGQVMTDKAKQIRDNFSGGEVEIMNPGSYADRITKNFEKDTSFFGKSAQADQDELIKKAVAEQLGL